MTTQTPGLAARLQEIRESEAVFPVSHSQRSALAAALEMAAAPPRVVVPVPRRARMFVRHGEGPGEFSDVTLTGPGRGSAAAPA